MYAVIATGGKQYRVEKGGVLRIEKLSAEPGATVDEDEDRSVWLLGAIDVELLDLAWAIRFTLWLSEPAASLIASAGVAFGDLEPQRSIKTLIVRGIEFDLVHLHPDMRTFRMRRGANPALVGEYWCCD